MSSPETSGNEFLNKLTEIIEANITNPQFGVSMLAKELGMGRATLHRKVAAAAKITVSQFINHVRLKKALDILRHTNATVSDVAFQTGFSSTSYFIKCFHEFYGYPPGQVGERDTNESGTGSTFQAGKKRRIILLSSVFIVVVIALVLFLIYKPFSANDHSFDLSIAILPFIDDSPEEGNEYVIKSLRKDIYSKLEKIKNLRVIPGIIVEEYTDSELGIKEIARKLKADYILYGSGQKINATIKIYLYLMDAKTGNNVWNDQLEKEIIDVFDLSEDVALEVADELKVYITPEERSRISKRATDNKLAWDYYSRGIELKRDSPKVAITYFQKAIELDNKFALAYAQVAYVYYDFNDRIYADSINIYADRSQFYDDELTEGWIAKAMYYHSIFKFKDAIRDLNRALDINRNSYEALNVLSAIYRLGGTLSDTEKTLELKLKQNRLEMTGIDSIEKSYFYVSLSDAFCEAGFFNEARFYLDKALEFNPDNDWAKFNIAIGYDRQDINYEQQRDFSLYLLKTKRARDTTYVKLRVARACLQLGDYSMAYQYFDEARNEGIPPNLNFIYVMLKLNRVDEAEKRMDEMYEQRKKWETNDIWWARYYALKNDPENALAHIRKFLITSNNYQYFNINSIKDERIFENFQDLPEYNELIKEIEDKFWQDHERIKASLKKQGLL